MPWLLAVILGLLGGARHSSGALPPPPSVTLAWDANTESDLAGYKVRYGTSSGTYTQIVDVGNTTTVVFPNLNYATTYYFVVTAYNWTGIESLPSNEVSFTAPGAPVSLVVLPNPSVTLAWDANTESDLAGYKVRYGTSSGVYTQVVDVGKTTTTVIPNLSFGTTYFLVVTAYNTSGIESLPSNEVTFTPQAPSVSLVVFALAAQGDSGSPPDASNPLGDDVPETDGSYSFTFAGTPGRNIAIYCSTDFNSWKLMETAQNPTGKVLISDSTAAVVDQRYYQVLPQ